MSRILFCEDDVTIHKLIRMALRGSEHEVMMATDGAQGLKMAKEHRPVVVFTDVAMPVMTGFELADALRDPRVEIHCAPLDTKMLQVGLDHDSWRYANIRGFLRSSAHACSFEVAVSPYRGD